MARMAHQIFLQMMTSLCSSPPIGKCITTVSYTHLALRFTDLQGGANVSLLLYNFEEKLERYNMPDSLKAQHTAFLTTGNVCYSDMGRVMCSFIHDTVGWHDTICGISDAKLIEQKHGIANYQTHRNDMYRSCLLYTS